MNPPGQREYCYVLIWFAIAVLLVLAWRQLRRQVTQVSRSRLRRISFLVAGLRGALLGGALSIALTLGLCLVSGKAGRAPYFFQAVLCGTTMIGVPFTAMLSVLEHLKEPA